MSGVTKTHYEILSQKGNSTRWDLMEVKDDRKTATAAAEEIWSTGRFSGVKVMKESYDSQSNAYGSVEIFSRGANRKVSKYDESGKVAHCVSPDQLYNAVGRSSVRELLQQTLDEWNLTPTELLHSVEHYNKLNDAGTRLQNAVQRAAIAQSEGSSVQERMRNLYRVIDQAVAIVKKTQDEIPSLEAGRLRPLIDAFGDKDNKDFLITICITEYLRPAVTLEDKFGRAVALINSKHPGWILGALDQMIAEFLALKKLLPALFGPQKQRSDFMVLLAEFQGGSLDVRRQDMGIGKLNPDLLVLDSLIGMGKLPQTRMALIERLKQEIESPGAVRDGSLVDKLEGLKEINTILAGVDLDDSVREGLQDALKERSARMINSQSVGEYVQEFKSPDKKLNGLVDVVDAAVGKSARRAAGNFLAPVLDTPDNEAWFLAIGGNPAERLKLISKLSQDVQSSELIEMHKRQVTDHLDKFSRIIADKTGLLKKVMKIPEGVVDKVHRLLEMMAEGYFPPGSVHNEAEQKVRVMMKHKDFMLALATGFGQKDAQTALKDFRVKLVRAGISEQSEKPAEAEEEGEED